MKRRSIAELLDTDAGTPAEIAASLADLRFINRSFGGLTTTEAMIERVAQRSGRQALSLLEVAAGSGYLPKAIQQRLEAQGIHLKVSLLDRAWTHLRNGAPKDVGSKAIESKPTDSKPSESKQAASIPRFPAVAGDALALPFRDSSFDVVSCNLFAHHLSTEQTIQFVNEALRVCRIAVLVNDLIRNRLHLAVVYAGLPLFRSRITWHDAPASVSQAYTIGEMQSILEKTRAAKVEIRRSYLFRMGAIAWKDAGCN